MDYKYPVSCPLLHDELINEEICFDIHMVVCGDAPEYTAPSDIFANADYKSVCQNCQYHRED